ncbi:MAG TPA: Fmu (Sun) domain-containing protein [Chitinophagaceae bacterium]|nr:Fmu (Sun) domain-containing protein [Chitinophagaceae bacterium]
MTRYKGEEPLSSYLKKYFSSSKKFGARDRREISHVCYCYFRLGKAAMSLTIEERLLTGLLLCSDQPGEILSALEPEWNEKVHLPLQQKLLFIHSSLLITDVFPWKNELSDAIDHEKFSESFFTQPDLFIRLRPGSEKTVIDKLQKAKHEFKMISESCLAFPNSSRLSSIIELDKEAVIQDYNSQRVDKILRSAFSSARNEKPAVWDCCAGSGGKSIMAHDINSRIDLTVSDVRESILANLKKRFANAGIKNYKSYLVDLTSDESEIPNLKSEMIICDAPCTGSGTWSRTPEQLYFFNDNEIERFSFRQKKIVSNVIPRLQSGGSFIYITCSVFRKENEGVVEFIKENFHLQMTHMEVLKGYDKKADSMFAALFEKL